LHTRPSHSQKPGSSLASILYGVQYQSSLLTLIQPIGTRLWLGLGVAKISR